MHLRLLDACQVQVQKRGGRGQDDGLVDSGAEVVQRQQPLAPLHVDRARIVRDRQASGAFLQHGLQEEVDRRVVRRRGRGLPLPIAPGRSIWRRWRLREARVIEVLRCWAGWRVAAHGDRTGGVDHKTARRYVRAGWSATVCEGQLTDERTPPAWEALLAEQTRIRGWIETDGLQLTNIHGKLARHGVVVPDRTLHRFAIERCGSAAGSRRCGWPTVSRGWSASWTSASLGWCSTPDRVAAGVNALVFGAVYSRHTFDGSAPPRRGSVTLRTSRGWNGAGELNRRLRRRHAPCRAA